MRNYRGVCAAAAVALLVLGVAPAAAQDAGDVGLLMTSGSSVGVSIQAGESVAIRPSISFSRSTSEFGGIADGEVTSTGWAPGVSVVFYVKSWEGTRLYVSPQWTYSRSTSSEEGSSIELKSTGHSLSAMVGAQHNLGSRFAVFGEVGLGRMSAESEPSVGIVNNKATNWSTRSTIGGILFF